MFSIVISMIVGILGYLMRDLIGSAFTKDSKISNKISDYMIYVSIFAVLMGGLTPWEGYLRALSRYRMVK